MSVLGWKRGGERVTLGTPREERSPADALVSAQRDPPGTSDLRDCEMTHPHFRPRSLWHVVQQHPGTSTLENDQKSLCASPALGL